MEEVATAGRADSFDGWAAALRAVVADPQQPRLLFQPIVDLSRGVVAGYECLSRFDGPHQASPDIWFSRAADRGMAVDLELRVIRRALETRAELPDDTFLTINVSPEVLASEPLAPMLRGAGSLDRLVFEITEHSAVSDYRTLTEAVRLVRSAGGRVAVDDAGAGYSSLRHILELRPDFVKLDRSLIASVHHDPAMSAVVQMLGDFASGLDSWVVGEGVERIEELDVLCALGVPLAQGFLLGAPGQAWVTPPPQIVARLRARATNEMGKDAVATLCELRPTISVESNLATMRAGFEACAGASHLAQLDQHGRPLGLIHRRAVEDGNPFLRPTLIVSATTPLREAAARAMQRPEETRFDPIICTISSGLYFGIVPLERIVTMLSR